MNRRVAVVGATGQLGADVVAAFQLAGDDVVGLAHSDLDLTSPDSVREGLAAVRPAVIVNTAAMADVEQCERDPLRAFAVNAAGVAWLARGAAELNARLLHISTDYVFDGRKNSPYVESDAVGPLNAYGNSKASGDFFVQALAPGSAIVRVSGLYGRHPCRSKGGLNFVDTMLRLARERGEVRVVEDQRISPTHTADVGRQLVALSHTAEEGVFHAASNGECSWYEFAAAIFEEADVPVKLQPAKVSDYPSSLRRPMYSVLANARLQTLGMDAMPHWREALHAYFTD